MSESTPDLATQPGDELLLALADDYLRRCRAGEQPAEDEYVSKHPELADRIRELFPAMIAMEQPGPGATVDLAPPTERVGAIIGRYKLLERIGEGGFGIVYMAEQQHPVRRKVALKVIKPGIDTRQVIARFEAERQALALMDHENIAKVFDAGATDSGRPYFVMELVRGVPITEFCDKNEFNACQRLELFVEVCRAVQHAHTKGIIHRDIKPTNILVTLHEGVPVPKVIDFGIAKATGQQLTEKTLFTNFAQLVGTPLYMSPEQAEMTGIDVDTRSDVYSLGVLLYELLTGTTPLDSERLKRAAFDEVRRIIREEEPPRPSARLSTMGDQAKRSISAHRKSDPNQLGRLVRGELDWIVMKALEKERARRYETASALAADVQRYLRNEPVEACPPSALYRLRKLARRRKGLVAGLSGIGLLLIAGAGILAVSNVRVSEALERERYNSYRQRVALANREWSANNLSRMEGLLDACPEDLRGWEWDYLKRLRYSAHRPLHHDSPVLSAAFSPDGLYVVTGTQAGGLYVWEAKSGTLLQTWPAHQVTACSVAFSPDGRYLASGGWDSTVKVWEMRKVLKGNTGKPTLQLQHSTYVRSVAFSPDGGRLLMSTGRAAANTGRVQMWNVNSRHEEFSLDFPTQVNCVQFSPEGRRFTVADEDYLSMWDASGDPRRPIWRTHCQLLQTVSFSSDGHLLATVGGLIAVHPDQQVKIWNAYTGREVQSLPGHVGGLRSVAFSPDRRRLASCGLDQTVRIWDTATWQEVLTLRGHLDNVFCVAFSADGRQLASTSLDRTARIWDGAPLEGERTQELLTLSGHAGAVTDVAFHPTGGHKLVSAGTDGTVRVWDTEDGAQLDILRVLPLDFGVKVAYSPDGRRLAVASGASGRAAVTIWDPTSAVEMEEIPGQTAAVLCVAFSPDGGSLASAGMDSTVRLRDISTGSELPVFKGHTWPIFDLAFNPDGQQLASGSSDNTVRIWNWRSGHLLRTLEPAHRGRVTSVDFSRDGALLASASWDRTVKFWNTSSWELQDTLKDPTGGILCVAFGPGRRMVWGSTDSTVKVWDGPGTGINILRGHTSWVQAVSVSPDGELIASASLDGTVKVWQAPKKLSANDPDVEN